MGSINSCTHSRDNRNDLFGVWAIEMTNIKLIIIAGCGALGSRIAMDVARPEIPMVLIDHDRVVEENIATSIYTHPHIGMMKTGTLGTMLYHKFNVITDTYEKKLVGEGLQWTTMNLKNIPHSRDTLIIDTFDNIKARKFTSHWRESNSLHISVGLHNIGAIEWDEVYKLPSTDPDEDICTHMAGRDLIVLTSAVAIRMANLFLDTGEKRSAIVNTEPEIIR